jgi:hypothetical protein
MGLMLGGAMRPNLAGDDRPAGPQIIRGQAASRSTGPFDAGPNVAGRAGQIPDYVLGTDWRKAASLPEAPPAASPPANRLVSGDDPPPPMTSTAAGYGEPLSPPPHARYPSTGGDAPPRAPVGQAVDDADEAPGATA